MKDSLLKGLVLLLSIIIACFAAETILRIAGKKPWRLDVLDIQVEPEHTWVIKHDTLGYVHSPGRRTITINKGLSYAVTVDKGCLRITRPLEAYTVPLNKDQIWVFGCSFTFGVCNDSETFPWLLQELMPDYEIVNFGIAGGSNLQSLIRCKEAFLTRKLPKVVVLAYSSFHDERNTFTRNTRKVVLPYCCLGDLRMPYARLNRDGRLNYYKADAVFREFPLMRSSALAALLERTWDKVEKLSLQSHSVTKALIRDFNQLCRDRGVIFVVAGLSRDPETQDLFRFCAKEGIPYADGYVNLARPGYNNAPFDGHPSPRANREYADKLAVFLKGLLSESSGQ